MKRLISFLIGLGILILIYSRIDIENITAVFQDSHFLWLIISLGMVIPITAITSWRLQYLIPHESNPGFEEANKLILAASSLNMILPSKAGDIAKAYFLADRGHLSRSYAISLTIFEKTCDMMSLLLWCGFGLLFYPAKDPLFWVLTVAVIGGLILGILMLRYQKVARTFFQTLRKIAPGGSGNRILNLQKGWLEMHEFFWSNRRRLGVIGVVSIFIWFLHLLQIWFFILALNAQAPFIISLALSPLAILIGLLPITFAGLGTRDAALIAFYLPYFSAAVGAALGLLCTTRYLIPGIAGLPFLHQYMSSLKIKRNV